MLACRRMLCWPTTACVTNTPNLLGTGATVRGSLVQGTRGGEASLHLVATGFERDISLHTDSHEIFARPEHPRTYCRNRRAPARLQTPSG
eukprot:1159639-Pelagomonas_calceolata.AAC.5